MSDRPGIINLQGKDYATWPYVLDKAHAKGLKGIACDIVQIPTKENGMLAIVKAVAHFEDMTFSALGDASPENTGPKIAKHIVRMAETRAKGRALRDALNIGMTLQEELGEDDAIPAKSEAQSKWEAKHCPTCEQCGADVGDPRMAQISKQRWGLVLCLEHGKEMAAIEKAKIPAGQVG